MKKADGIIKSFFERPEIAADLINTAVYKENKLKAEDLKLADIAPVLQTLTDLQAEKTFEDFSDSYGRTVVMKSENFFFVIMAETEVDYGLPIKESLFEIGLYAEQEKHRGAFDGKAFLTPAVTLTVYLSPKDWEGCYKLSDMYGESNGTGASFAPEYKLHITEPSKLTEEQLAEFSTELGSAFRIIKNCGGEKAAEEYAQASEKVKELIDCLFEKKNS